MVNQTNSNNATNNTAKNDDKNIMSIAQYLKSAQSGHKRSIPPMAQWQPKHCGKMDLKVLARFYLRTPVEQIEIEVEDEPLFVNQVDSTVIADKKYIQFTTTNADLIIVDAEHSIFMREFAGELRPYVHVRFGINALIQRSAFFHLIEMGELVENKQGDTILSLQSGDFHLQLGT